VLHTGSHHLRRQTLFYDLEIRKQRFKDNYVTWTCHPAGKQSCYRDPAVTDFKDRGGTINICGGKKTKTL